jgi:hypothetical protein
MNGFFKPLRRKIGVLTLALACVLMAGWFRSRFNGNSIYFGFGGAKTTFLVSVDSSLLLVTCHEWPGSEPMQPKVPRLESHDYIPSSGFYHLFNINDNDVEWKWRVIGLGAGEKPVDIWSHGRRYTFWIAPYWSIVIPVTLLPAWLLLSKPKQPKPTTYSAT